MIQTNDYYDDVSVYEDEITFHDLLDNLIIQKGFSKKIAR